MVTNLLRRPAPLTAVAVLASLFVWAAWWFPAHVSAESWPFTDLLKAYQPRELCMFYEPGVIWMHLISDATIALSYYSIPIALIYFVRKRTDLTFSWMYLCFAVFILACGTTHVMNILALWYAPYRLDGIVKLFTAVVSVATAGMLWPLLPKALAIPSPDLLRAANTKLAREVGVRRQAEDSLRAMQIGLEKRVEARTAELREANLRLQSEMEARGAAEKERELLLEREREARAEAERANRIKDEFLATLSHELRTPLSAITSWVYVLQAEAPKNPEITEGLAVIERNALAQGRLIDDLLDMSRIISGKLRLQRSTVSLRAIVEAAGEGLRPIAEKKGIRLGFHFPPDVPVIEGDAARLQQVVGNLLSNAIKFTPIGGQATVTLALKSDTITLAVTDTGIGIAPEFLPRLFERFRQADSTTTRRHGGLGLGLAIVRELVVLHGGTVEARSAGPGTGATFLVKIPITGSVPAVTQNHPVTPSREATDASTRLDGAAVLIVEDEPDARDVLRRILEQAGATVTTAENATQGLALCRDKAFDLLVSDIGMPGEDGYSFIQKVRRLLPPPSARIPAVALTAFARSEDRQTALDAGFNAHLAKPVSPERLLEILAQLRVHG